MEDEEFMPGDYKLGICVMVAAFVVGAVLGSCLTWLVLG